jgi:hypothetical protein
VGNVFVAGMSMKSQNPTGNSSVPFLYWSSWLVVTWRLLTAFKAIIKQASNPVYYSHGFSWFQKFDFFCMLALFSFPRGRCKRTCRGPKPSSSGSTWALGRRNARLSHRTLLCHISSKTVYLFGYVNLE